MLPAALSRGERPVALSSAPVQHRDTATAAGPTSPGPTSHCLRARQRGGAQLPRASCQQSVLPARGAA